MHSIHVVYGLEKKVQVSSRELRRQVNRVLVDSALVAAFRLRQEQHVFNKLGTGLEPALVNPVEGVFGLFSASALASVDDGKEGADLKNYAAITKVELFVPCRRRWRHG